MTTPVNSLQNELSKQSAQSKPEAKVLPSVPGSASPTTVSWLPETSLHFSPLFSSTKLGITFQDDIPSFDDNGFDQSLVHSITSKDFENMVTSFCMFVVVACVIKTPSWGCILKRSQKVTVA